MDRDNGLWACIPLIIFPKTALTSEEPEDGEREEYCLRTSAISLTLLEGKRRKKREQGFGSSNSHLRLS